MSKFSDDLRDPLSDYGAWEEYEAMMREQGEPEQAAFEPDHAAFARLAATLTPEQVTAATHIGAIQVLAGAGTGKTSTLTAAVVHKIAVQGLAPSRILAATFTNKAASEMTSRIQNALSGELAPNWLGTYHGLAARQLRASPEVAGLRPNFDILDADDSRRIVKRVMKAFNLDGADDEPGTSRDPIKIICNRISRWKDDLVTPNGAAILVDNAIAKAERNREPLDVGGFKSAVRVYAAYQKALREANAADFGDLLLWPCLAMHQDPAYCDRWQSRFDCILADEYQDVNFAQYSWLKALAKEHENIFVVGDDDQAIYSWRGSDIAYIRRYLRDFPNAVQVRLEENFRSTGLILNAANALIAKDKKRLGKTLFTHKGDGEKIEIVEYRDAQCEALGLAAELIQRHKEGVGWDECGILYRNNALSRVIEDALLKARIPHCLVGDVSFFHRAEIKDALAHLQLAAHPDDRQSDEAFRRIINEPRRGFGPKNMESLEADASFRNISLLKALETAPLPPKAQAAGLLFAQQIRNIAGNRSHTLADLISLLITVTGYRAMLQESKAETSEDKLENIQELILIAGSFHTARDLLDHAALATNRPDEDDTGVVRLMTMHKAKGLEFPHVFLPAWEEKIMPSDYGDADEERRLAYVALTRGMRRVTISHTGFRRGAAFPSLFLNDIPEECFVKGWLRDQNKKRQIPKPPDRSSGDWQSRSRRY